MFQEAPNGGRTSQIYDLQPGVVTSGIARALAGSYRGMLEQELPATLSAILQRLETRGPAPARSATQVALIVEDDHDVRSLAAALLEETELDVVEVDSAEGALAYLQEHGGEVAMIFADVRLPGAMDGVQLARAACTLWPSIRIVLTSGTAGHRVEDLPDCVVFLPKPWRGLDVLVQAEKALRQPQPLVS